MVFSSVASWRIQAMEVENFLGESSAKIAGLSFAKVD
jgi:hypothetical protein